MQSSRGNGRPMRDIRRAIGIEDMSFELVTVKSLVEREVLYRPIDGNHGRSTPRPRTCVRWRSLCHGERP